jgi:hypothetical protein
MKLYLGWVVSAGVMATAATANAQVLVPYRIGAPTVVISDVDGPYAAIPPEVVVPSYGPPVLPPREISAIARENGFAPLGAPQQRGGVYTISAINRDGEDGRLVIDARNGRLVRFMPADRMGDRMGEETVTTYGPVGGLPPAPNYRRAPHPAAVPRLASRTPAVPLPKAPPPRAVATPAKPVAKVPAVAVAPEVKPEVPTVQQAVATPKPDPDKVRVIPLDAAHTVDAPADAKPAAPAIAPTEAMPPVQGLD